MSDLFIFDIYTAKVFGIVFVVCGGAVLCFWLGYRFPRQAERVGKCILPLVALLMLSFCCLQVADMERRIGKEQAHD
jgi:hypothetical protein